MPAKELQELDKWKVGEKVVVGDGQVESITTIKRITDGRGGTIYTSSKHAFDIHGHERSSDTWHSKFITPATMEDIKRVQGEVSKSWLTHYKWHNITGEQALQVEGFLKGIGISIREKKT